METVESIERKMRRQRILVRILVAILIIALCFFIGWLISYSTYDGIDHIAFDAFIPGFSIAGHA